MKPPIRLLAIDIDGTLLDPQFQISEANLRSLRRAHAAGVEVVLVTGRRHMFALPIAQALGFDLWLISSNGAVTKSTQGEHFFTDKLPAASARKLIRHMNEFRSNAVLTFDREDRGSLVVERTAELHGSISRWMEKNEAYIERVVPLEDALVADPIQIMYCGTIARMVEAQARLAAAGMSQEITVLKTEYVARDLTILDVLNQGCSKGHALERWTRHRGIVRNQVMAIGDNYNDVEMLEFSGVPVIMGNACPELKRFGWRVTASNEQNGVAVAVEQVLGVGAGAIGKQ
ncbi:MAG: Cof-type HAD-IIB family hydrolase [Acidobacteriia bacterium]|nr:Cof-type HAD-IIB family hydrolase [Terriglobia bacterium]